MASVLGGKCPGGMCPWGKCPGGTCPGGGGVCPRTTYVTCNKTYQFVLNYLIIRDQLRSYEVGYFMMTASNSLLLNRYHPRV